MSLWWLQEGWTDALCGDCGRNIWKDGGDPDWGYCYDCYSNRLDNQKQQQPKYEEMHLEQMTDGCHPKHELVEEYTCEKTGEALVRCRCNMYAAPKEHIS